MIHADARGGMVKCMCAGCGRIRFYHKSHPIVDRKEPYYCNRCTARKKPRSPAGNNFRVTK